ncbi:MAG: lysoplasmalogenase [Actinomycetota bacterium]
MNTTTAILFVLAGIAAVIDWWGVSKERVSVEFMSKPLVIIALIGAALAIDSGDGIVRGLVIAALGAALVGDVVLSTPDARFEAGVFALMIAHVLYIASFLQSGSLDLGAEITAGLLIVGVGLGSVPQILAGAREHGRVAHLGVMVFGVLAATMATLGAATAEPTAAIGGALFLASDALLAWNRFVAPAPGGRALVHATDHLGQMGLVLWLAA